MNLQRSGGLASFGAAATFLAGFYLFFSLLMPARYGALSVAPLQHVAFLKEHLGTLYAWNLTIYVLFGALLVVLTLALHERLRGGAPALSRLAAAFGTIWATLVIASGMLANVGADMVVRLHAHDPAAAATLWLGLSMVVNGLGGGNEIVGGIWLLLLSLAARRDAGWPKTLAWLGLLVSAAGLASAVPPLKELGMAFGLGLIAWFLWAGGLLLRGRQD
ncbi:hypothetical protein [Paucibacter soli]|uniref:hypothetical protein n=1 Tax=Paucibacter soli TaxID=3133433 RepID=UPI0030AE51BF